MKVKHVVLGMTASLAVTAVAALLVAVGFAMLGMNIPAILAGLFALLMAYLAYRVAKKRHEIEAVVRGALAVLLIGATVGYTVAAPVAHAASSTGGLICGGVVDLACRALKLIDIGSFFASIGVIAFVFFIAMLFAVGGNSALVVLLDVLSLGASRNAAAALLVVMFLGLFLMAALFGVSKVCIAYKKSFYSKEQYCIPSNAPEVAMQSTLLGKVLYNYAKVFFDQLFSQLTGGGR